MARQVRHYSDFLTSWCSLVGIPTDRLSTEIAAVANTSFNSAMQKMQSMAPWLEISPYGEARFIGNRLTYPNDLSKTAYWTTTALTMTANAMGNPGDGSVTATKAMETAATSAHSTVQTVTNFFPSTGYTVSFYARPNGRNNVYLSVSDGAVTYTAFFDISAGTVGTVSNFSSYSCALNPNGYYLCKATFTASSSATTSGSFTIQLSSDGSTLSYAGDTSKGVYIWGALAQQTSNVPVSDSVLEWDQTGEYAIDTVYCVYRVNPFVTNYPSQYGYNLTTGGVQIVNGTPYQYSSYTNGVAQTNVYGAPPNNPVWLYYRKTCPNYTGSVYSATATYTVGQQVYFTNSSSYGDYYKCLIATSAGQSPDTNPTYWELIPVYDTFLNFCIFQAYGDWLVSDGQADKAQGAYSLAQDKLADQNDKYERQMQMGPPLKVSTHLTSRPAY